MPIQNDFLTFAAGGAANVVSQSVYAALSAIANGYSSGTAQSNQVNKTLRQSSIMAALIADFIVNQTGQPAIDDGTTATLLTNFIASVSGRLLNIQTFASPGTSTYTPSTGTMSIIVEAIGGGGAGGGCPATSSSQIAAAGGGGSAGYGRARYLSPSSLSVTVGAGGVAVSGSGGGTGGTTSFGSLLSAPGGTGGQLANLLPGTVVQFDGAAPPGGPATGSGIIVAAAGTVGAYSIIGSLSAAISGPGAASYLGGGGIPVNGSTNPGVVAHSPGAGGSGATAFPSSSAQIGGNGGPGLVIVYEYA